MVDCAGTCGGPFLDENSGNTTVDGLGTDECGVCGGPGAVYECGCAMPEGVCDCEENLDTCSLCPNINPNGYGDCGLPLGYAFTGVQCQSVSGCGVGGDTEWFFETFEECEDGCQNCKILDADGYGSCEMVLGWGWTGEVCELISGCGVGDDEPWFYNNYEICSTRCDINYNDCVDGETNNDNPCNPWECWGGQWYEIIIDCAEQEGVPCEGGVYVSPEEGECCSICVLSGDLNGDGTINVIDIVMTVDLILNDNYDLVGDVNEDGQLNVIDIVMLVNWVLNGMPEADSDGDGVLDEDDSDPNNPYQCSDLDGDTCDDCSTGTFSIFDDGYDYDGDGQCDDGDCDDDNDGCQECWDYCP